MSKLTQKGHLVLRQGWILWIAAVVIVLCASLAMPERAFAQASTDVLGEDARTQFWEAVRHGARGSVSIHDPNAAQLIQSEGDNWRAVRNGPISVYAAQAIIGMLLILAIFYMMRGRVTIAHGWSGWTVERFTDLERFGHWLVAGSFIVLGLSGLNMLYGRYVLLPLLGPEVFATLTSWGKVAHHYVAFAFMTGLALVFVMWVKHNFPSRVDINWALKGGGLVGTDHPPAEKFNLGQKIIFWLVVLCGLSISLSGLSLLFPFQFSLFADTFAIMNAFGFDLPTDLTPLQEMQLSQVWHSSVSAVLIAVVVAHIYIGSMGMEGAFAAMGSGRVDLNWAKEHHSLWVEEMDEKGELHLEPAADGSREAQPAE